MISLNEPYLNGKEKIFVKDTLKKNWISNFGEYNKRFEKSLSTECPEPASPQQIFLEMTLNRQPKHVSFFSNGPQRPPVAVGHRR